MEPGAAVAAYGVESAVEGTAAAAYVVAKPTMPLRGEFTRITTTSSLPRTNHTISIVKGVAYIFGGRDAEGSLADNTIHTYTLPSGDTSPAADYKSFPAAENSPEPRHGHSASVVDEKIFIYGGCGQDSKPIQEDGAVWAYDTRLKSWNKLVAEGNTFGSPEARSFHAAASWEHPVPSEDDKTATPVGGEDTGGGTLFVHGGTVADGRCLRDTWAFDISSRMWTPYTEAPGPGRRGASLAIAQDKLWRYGGSSEDGAVDSDVWYMDLVTASFDDAGGKGELGVTPRTGVWESVVGTEVTPGPRSRAGFFMVTTGAGRFYLLLVLGEKPAEEEGKAGKFEGCDDVWSFQLRPQGLTGASFKDAVRQAVGSKTGQYTWGVTDIPEFSKEEGALPHPSKRTGFATAAAGDLGPDIVVVWGGSNSNGETLGDGWILHVS